jgi:hypothetical protein
MLNTFLFIFIPCVFAKFIQSLFFPLILNLPGRAGGWTLSKIDIDINISHFDVDNAGSVDCQSTNIASVLTRLFVCNISSFEMTTWNNAN